MKSIVMEEIVDRKYFLAAELSRYYWCNGSVLDIKNASMQEGYISFNDTHNSWNEVITTYDFTREFKVDEYLHIGDKDYSIIKVSHTPKGTIIYYIDHKIINEDIESKEKAKRDLEERRNILKQRIEEREKMQEPKSTIKKWYQLWK